MELRYPSRNFGKTAKSAFDAQQPLKIFIKHGWRSRLLAAAVAPLPTNEIPDPKLIGSLGWAWLVPNLIFPTFFVIHWAFVRAGYSFQHQKIDDQLTIEYFKR